MPGELKRKERKYIVGVSYGKQQAVGATFLTNPNYCQKWIHLWDSIFQARNAILQFKLEFESHKSSCAQQKTFGGSDGKYSSGFWTVAATRKQRSATFTSNFGTDKVLLGASLLLA
jgi:hypothetical protein